MKKVCPVCGADFFTKGSVGKYCSRTCFAMGMKIMYAQKRTERQKQTTRTCRDCGLVGPVSEFAKSASRRKGYEQLCKPCKANGIKAWRRANPEKVRKYNAAAVAKVGGSRFWKYGLTDEQIEQMALAQSRKCAICGREPDKLVVDHNHDTGKVRGLLCHTCNTALGKFRDSQDILSAAIRYLAATQDSLP